MPVSTVVLHANEVAAACGLNPYRTPGDVLRDVRARMGLAPPAALAVAQECARGETVERVRALATSTVELSQRALVKAKQAQARADAPS